MAKISKRFFAIIMVACVFASVLPSQALAAEVTTVTEETITDGGLTTVVTTTTTEVRNESGSDVTVSVEIQKDTTGVTADGADYERHETDYTEFNSNQWGWCTGEYGSNEGSEVTKDELEFPEGGVTVQVPDEVGETNTETYGGTSTPPTGDINTPEGQITVTVTPGEVSVTTTEKNVVQNDVIVDPVTGEIVEHESDLEHVRSETNPTGSNDLVHAGDHASDEFLPGYTGETVIPEGVEGYEYVYVGSGNTSKFVPAILFEEPLTDEQKLEQYGEDAYIGTRYRSYYIGQLKPEDKARIAYNEDGSYVTDENGFILDIDGNRIFKEERTAVGPNGETTYMHRFDNFNDTLKVEGFYENGEWVKPMNGPDGYYTIWAGPQQFVLVDSKGNIVSAYCADFSTPTQDFYGYNIENLEDADYYSEDEASHIRSIAYNGYWGTVGYELDENGEILLDEEGNPVPKKGSLEAVRQMLEDSGDFTEEELNCLNDGVALTATQMAIWSCSNKQDGIRYVNSFYSNWGAGNVPADKTDEVILLFKVYEHFMALEPTESTNHTSDTIINSDSFIGDMSVTVVKKDETHENNADDNADNDAYVTNLTFALIVEPDTEKDDLVVTVVDANGNELARGRIAGAASEGETVLNRGDDGNYSFEGITITEGSQSIKLNLSGVQYLERGVYLYSSEIREDTTSQTLVGVASGNHAVSVSMDIKFELDVNDGIVATERVWDYEYDPVTYDNPPPPPPEPYRFDPDTYEEIPDEDVPLAAPVVTGDSTMLWVIVVLAAVLALAAVNLHSVKRPRSKHKTF